MDTLNPYVKINTIKHRSIKYWWNTIIWKLQLGKGPICKIYRYFWRKRLMKRINETARIINERSKRGPHDFNYMFPETMNKPNYDLSVPVGVVKPTPLNLPLGWVPQGITVGNPGIIAPIAGVPVMDPAKLYKLTPDIHLPEFPVVRRRICHLRKKKIWKFHMKPC